MAVDMFLELEGVKGETNDKAYKSKNAMDILAWSWGLSNTGTFCNEPDHECTLTYEVRYVGEVSGVPTPLAATRRAPRACRIPRVPHPAGSGPST